MFSINQITFLYIEIAFSITLKYKNIFLQALIIIFKFRWYGMHQTTLKFFDKWR